MTTVVNWRTDKYDLYIGRPSRWGNPFKIGAETRILVVARYALYLLNSDKLIRAVCELEGLRLGCWCAPEMCHGHVLASLADGVLCETELADWGKWVLAGSPGWEVNAPEMEKIQHMIFEAPVVGRTS